MKKLVSRTIPCMSTQNQIPVSSMGSTFICYPTLICHLRNHLDEPALVPAKIKWSLKEQGWEGQLPCSSAHPWRIHNFPQEHSQDHRRRSHHHTHSPRHSCLNTLQSLLYWHSLWSRGQHIFHSDCWLGISELNEKNSTFDEKGHYSIQGKKEAGECDHGQGW